MLDKEVLDSAAKHDFFLNRLKAYRPDTLLIRWYTVHTPKVDGPSYQDRVSVVLSDGTQLFTDKIGDVYYSNPRHSVIREVS